MATIDQLSALEPAFARKVSAVMADLKAQGWKPKIAPKGGWRDLDEQRALKASGNSTVSFSFHNAVSASGQPAALAVDLIDSRYAWSGSSAKAFFQALGQAAKARGLYWGGDWKNFPDLAHIQMHSNSALGEVRKQTEAVWAALKSGNLALLPTLGISGYLEVLRRLPWYWWAAIVTGAGFLLLLLLIRRRRRPVWIRSRAPAMTTGRLS